MVEISSPRAPGRAAVAEPALLAIVESTLRELHAGAPGMPAVTLASVLDRDLGLDSLTRMELLLRTEREFGVTLPEDTLQRTESVGDLFDALRRAQALAGSRAATVSMVAPASPLQPGAAMRAAAAEAPSAAVIGQRPGTLFAGVPSAGATVDTTPSTALTLLDVLDWHVQAHPDQTQIICLESDREGGPELEHVISYRSLAQSAAAVAAGLQRAGVQPRQCIAIMLPTSPEYFSTYVGILRAGAVPVPIYPPARASQLEDHVLRHTGILANAQACLLVTVPEAMGVARLLQARVPGLRHVLTPQQLAAQGGAPTPVPVHGDDIAFIQYTSGSTGNPKGVALTHANLLANIRAMAKAVQGTPRDTFVSWLPLYHDMGLIGAWLAPLYVGFPTVVMSPLAFLARPLRWLQAISRYHGTLSAAPNFAYELCLKHVGDADLVGLDLSSWRIAFNGAEAVSPDTVLRFRQRFARYGLRAEAVTPVYGLAEACVGLLFPPLGRAALVDAVQREPFSQQHRALPAAPGDSSALRFVACGRPLPGHSIRIVDDAGHELGERVEGRLEFKGPSATSGYFRNPQQTQALFHDGWLDTGDRAYMAGGDVFITGRVKDIIIRGGRNLYPQEIEDAVGAVDGVRKGCVAVFGSPDPATGTERLVVLAEVRGHDAAQQLRLREAVSRAVIGAIGEPPDSIVLAPAHTVLKTSSGKVRRSACRELVESGRIDKAAATPRRQVLRLALGALQLRLGALSEGVSAAIGRAIYGLRAWCVFWMMAPLTWLICAGLSSPARVWRVSHAAARALLLATGTRFQVHGLERLPSGPCVLVCNHGSYLDGMLLVAALPRPFAFVAKNELQRQFIAGTYLTRLGAMFVERFDAMRSVADATRLADAAAQGRSLAVFPEGTFVARPGLLPFHLGAFLAAARAGVPVLPVVLRGSRAILQGNTWWPRRAEIEVEVCDPVLPAGDAGDIFAVAVRLREAARRVIEQGLEGG